MNEWIHTDFCYLTILQVLESHSNTKWSFSPSDSRASREHYLAFAQQTYGLTKFAKVAYPDLVSGHSPPDLEEPLLEKNKQACRYVLFVQYNPFKISYVMLKKLLRQKTFGKGKLNVRLIFWMNDFTNLSSEYQNST